MIGCVRTLGTASVAVVGLLLTAGAASAQIFQDNVLEYRYGTTFREPTNPLDIAKSIINYTHVDGYRWGSNFLSVDYLISDGNDPANLGEGAREIYAAHAMA
jgi:hypothetical protein